MADELKPCPDTPPAPGMFMSDKCSICRDYYDKRLPWLCPRCYDAIKQAIVDYPLEFAPESAALLSRAEAAEAKLRALEDTVCFENVWLSVKGGSHRAVDAERLGDLYARLHKAEALAEAASSQLLAAVDAYEAAEAKLAACSEADAVSYRDGVIADLQDMIEDGIEREKALRDERDALKAKVEKARAVCSLRLTAEATTEYLIGARTQAKSVLAILAPGGEP